MQIDQKKARVSILKLGKVDFRAKKITRDRKGHYITIKGSIHQEDITSLKCVCTNNKASKYVKQKLI